MLNHLILRGLCFSLAFVLFSCNSKPDPWAAFTACAANACVPEAIAVRDAFLDAPKEMLTKFDAAYKKGDDHVIGWLYLLRDSVLFNPKYGSTEERFAMQQAIIAAARPFENDPKLGEMANSVLDEIESLAIMSELEDEDVDPVPLTGAYAFELPGDGGSGLLQTSMLSLDSVRFHLEVVAGPPAHNQGMLDGTAALSGHNMFEFRTTEYNGVCLLQFTFDSASVKVATAEGDASACGFGQNVSADHVYTVKSYDDPFLPAAEARKAKKLQGRWVSATDEKAEISFENGMFTESYAGEQLNRWPCHYFPKCPGDCNPVAPMPCVKVAGQDAVCYTVVKADGNSLELSMIGGAGNTLAYKRK